MTRTVWLARRESMDEDAVVTVHETRAGAVRHLADSIDAGEWMFFAAAVLRDQGVAAPDRAGDPGDVLAFFYGPQESGEPDLWGFGCEAFASVEQTEVRP